jgi:uroporphyrinogen-III synthase
MPLVLLTRPKPQAEAFAQRMHAQLPAHEVLIAPLTGIVTRPLKATVLAEACGVVLTSANALPALAGLSVGAMPAYCVGEATARAARAAGFTVSVADGDAASLRDLLLRLRPQEPLVHIHGQDLACDLSRVLTAEGITCHGIVGYEAREVPWDGRVVTALQGAECCLLPIFSPRAARLLCDRLPPERANLWPVAISAAAAAGLSPDLRGRACIASRPDADAMLAELRAAMPQGRPTP